ncbi:adhesion G-protein coupled receptor G5-like [Brienomyrus brachyistius]|uniref:adhesion G-protein coupled receptor G5-like n=1 Tax=Brienomyrus brachyistius TaxID=42636 RepID=UPI0020B2F77C|nr:adhesion G-protein coupled receptor G5-like [Brienomyrus brachyistius]XP_048886258.1 adhesion G-protein coupled receptor G5-like [Brienomyrus brachyistius]XP_048886259.1 adhesion G-protein coupled receptor G5-like [Brienomyrus brachyistius]
MDDRLWPWLNLMVLLILLGEGTNGYNLNFTMCGTWHHDSDARSLSLSLDVRRGCENLTVSANESTLSVQGWFTGVCENISTVSLTGGSKESPFCLYWDPLLDLLWLDLRGQRHSLCGLPTLREDCCSISPQDNSNAPGHYGIAKGSVKGDIIQELLQKFYVFKGWQENCVKNFCEDTNTNVLKIEHVVMNSGKTGKVDQQCIQGYVREVREGFQGLNISSSTPKTTPSVYLPPSLLPPGKKQAKVVYTYYSEATHFQKVTANQKGADLVNEVVGISVENEVIANLPEPIRISFWHQNKSETGSKRCVFWDPRKDSTVHWRDEGCKTHRRSSEETECSCDHLTYFALLLEIEQRDVSDLAALTWITALCCAISSISCFLLLILLNMPRRKSQEQSTHIHRNLVIAVLLLNLLFLFTGVVANLDAEKLCQVYGATLHYALLCTFTWMAIEVLNTFWLIYMVLKPQPKQLLLNVVGFGLPVIPITILLLNNIYGLRRLSDGTNHFYKMCWIRAEQGLLVHYILNVGFFAIIFTCGLLMLALVVIRIRDRPEWQKNKVTFLSIWGLSLLFGSSWGLGFLGFGAFLRVIQFLFCINALQGFFLLVRFWVLDRIRKKDSLSYRFSTTSTGQPMMEQSRK